MEKRLQDYSERIAREKKEQFDCFYHMLLEYNGKFNLTAITDEKEVFYKHFLDSCAGEFLFPPSARVCEVGSGAGFPSIPLKILRDDLRFTLVESTGKKCAFLRAVVDNLGFSGVDIINGRAEDLAKEENYRETFDCCTARAVARLNVLAEYCLPFVKVNGLFIVYKGEGEEEEKEARRAISLLGGKTEQSYFYGLGEYGRRSIFAVRKVKPTPGKYPRGNGKERKQPL